MRLYDYDASANCLKVRLTLAHLGLPYERVPVDIFAGETLTDEFARLNPFRSTPVLELDDGRTLIESNAIMVYLAEGTELSPATALGRAEVVRWLIWEQTDVMPMIGGLRFRLLTGRLAPDEPAALRRRAAGEEVLAFLDAALATTPFLVGGRFSIADIAIYAYVHVADEAGLVLACHPAVGAWIERVRSQPGHVDDLEPYPANSHAGVSRSIYDS
jgi:glutathione S-transferase